MTGGLFAVLDDIALLLDDAAMMSKVAARKTAGILGDDLAVNAEKATGFRASRELPVLWAITKGSFINKLIILPLAFLLSAYAPWLIVPILLIGGAYLSFEGVEKIYHVFVSHSSHSKDSSDDQVHSEEEMLKLEKSKIKSAVRTDFILSIEIIVIALGTVLDQTLLMQILVVSFIAILATVGVYGLVALIIRMDDVGFYLIDRGAIIRNLWGTSLKKCGHLLVVSLPKVIRALGVIGTVAMLLVGGGIFNHNVETLHHLFGSMPSLLANLISGIVVGVIVLLVVLAGGKLKATVAAR